MINRVPLDELKNRQSRFCSEMDTVYPEWEMAVIFSKLNQYYFTGTMQEGILIFRRGVDTVLWVRRSLERALDESEFPAKRGMESYREAAPFYGSIPDTVYLETEFVTLSMLSRFQKHFKFAAFRSIDGVIAAVRSIKSAYELELIKKSGMLHKKLLEDILPTMLRTGMSEAELGAELFSVMLKEGFHGISRFSMFDTDILLGHIGFGESSIYPSSFNGPGGNLGMSPAFPAFGSTERKLKEGDLVYIDVSFGVEGYHTDKTMTYMYHKKLPNEIINAQEALVDIQLEVAEKLKPGAIPSEIYKSVMDKLTPEFKENFMGYGARTVKFLGHGIGLTVDETPVIAAGFNKPLCENMVFAVEPKKGFKDIGMVGIENTFLTDKNGGISLTGSSRGLMLV